MSIFVDDVTPMLRDPGEVEARLRRSSRSRMAVASTSSQVKLDQARSNLRRVVR